VGVGELGRRAQLRGARACTGCVDHAGVVERQVRRSAARSGPCYKPGGGTAEGERGPWYTTGCRNPRSRGLISLMVVWNFKSRGASLDAIAGGSAQGVVPMSEFHRGSR
jgi:hypothetical protein